MSILAAFIAAGGVGPLTASNDGPIAAIGLGTVAAGPATITPTGGTPGYSYSAAYASGDTVTILGGTTQSVNVQRTGVLNAQFFTGVINVTVTDAAGRTAVTAVTWQITGG